MTNRPPPAGTPRTPAADTALPAAAHTGRRTAQPRHGYSDAPRTNPGRTAQMQRVRAHGPGRRRTTLAPPARTADRAHPKASTGSGRSRIRRPRASGEPLTLDARQASTEGGTGLTWRRARANAPAGSPETVRACDQ
ncbi:hypothetical protein GCM10010129_74200 [Streptomyces fumigatiscleroticus]|nr:hypothetical protein GCM10010129_74200 [Streptomyces fumigatiscleroticus]